RGDKMNRRSLFHLAVAAALVSPLWASRDAGLPGEFLNGVMGARPMAMGGAFTAVADDVNAIFWNPAGISLYRSNQVTFEYSPLVVGGSISQIGYSQPLYAAGNFGVGITNVTSGSVPETDINGSEIGSFSSRETGYSLAYARKFGDKWNFGGSL